MKQIKIFLTILATLFGSCVFGAAHFGQNLYLDSHAENQKNREINLQLGKAIADFDLNGIKFALANRADLNTRFKWKYSMYFGPRAILIADRSDYFSSQPDYSVLIWALENLPKSEDEIFKNRKYIDVLNLLIANGRINELYLGGEVCLEAYTPLIYAIKNKKYKLAKFLICKGADVDLENTTGHMALIKFINCADLSSPEEIEFCNYLIEHSNINKLTKQFHIFFGTYSVECTPFFYVVEFYQRLIGSKEINEYLITTMLEHGADIYAKDSKGNLLIEKFNPEVKKFVMDKHNFQVAKKFWKYSKEQNLVSQISNILILSYLGIVEPIQDGTKPNIDIQ